jgi:hypothetical protein
MKEEPVLGAARKQWFRYDIMPSVHCHPVRLNADVQHLSEPAASLWRPDADTLEASTFMAAVHLLASIPHGTLVHPILAGMPVTHAFVQDFTAVFGDQFILVRAEENGRSFDASRSS